MVEPTTIQEPAPPATVILNLEDSPLATLQKFILNIFRDAKGKLQLVISSITPSAATPAPEESTDAATTSAPQVEMTTPSPNETPKGKKSTSK